MKSKPCSECYGDFVPSNPEDETCFFCIEEADVKPAKKKKKTKNDKFEAPADDEVWISVPSPYKAYKEGV